MTDFAPKSFAQERAARQARRRYSPTSVKKVATRGPNPLVSQPIPTNRVRMVERGGDHVVEAWIDGPVLPVSQDAGWTVIPREGQMGTVEYQGVEPPRWTMPILVDGWSGATQALTAADPTAAQIMDMQADWDMILALSAQRGNKPPSQVWFAGTVPKGISGRAWLIEKIDVGEERLTDESNHLLRGKMTLNLLAPTATVDVASPIQQALAKGGSKSVRTIHARAGDTLVTIAARELGDPERWRELQSANNGLQPDNVKANQPIKVPSV
jgi:hypothetical protein